MDYYKILNLNKDCTIDDIKKSYKILALKWHPDRNPNNKEEAGAKFKEISEAYNILSKPKLREKYDNKQNSSFLYEEDINNFMGPFDLFNSFFNDTRGDFFRRNVHDNLFDNNFNNDFFNMNRNSFISSNTSSFSSFSSKKEMKSKYVNGQSIKETIIEDNNGKTEIYEINGKIKKKIVTKGIESKIYYYNDQGEIINKDNFIKDK